MKKTLQISSMLCLLCSFGAWADSFTVADFVGKDKFCTQLFYSSEMISDTPRPQEGAWGRFEAVEGSDNKVRLTSFKNGGSVTFTIDGDHLLLDGTESKEGTSTTDANGNTVKLRTVTHKTYQELVSKRVLHYFVDNPTQYTGNIVRESDGTISVTFDNNHLSFIARQNDYVIPSNYDNFVKDYANTFRKCELHILKANGEMTSSDGTETIPLTIVMSENENGQINIKNLCGSGENYFHPSVDSDVFCPEGITASINATNGLNFSRQPMTGNMSYTLNSKYLASIHAGGYITDLSVHNTFIEGGNGTVDVKYNVTNGWHKKYEGGQFDVLEISMATSEWGAYSEDENGNRTEIYPIQTRGIKMWRDVTPDVTLRISTCLYNQVGILLEGDLFDEINPELVESYDVFVIGNKQDSPTTGGFDITLDSGHSSAVCITDGQGATLRSGNSLHFSRIVPMDEIEAHGWNPYATDGYMTVYARLNLRDMTAGTAAPDDTTETDTPEASPRREASASLYSFSALTPTPQTLATSTELLRAENVTIRSTKGAIEITGNSGNATVYDAAGQTIYRGTDNRIGVTPGLYIVTTPTRTAKILVR